MLVVGVSTLLYSSLGLVTLISKDVLSTIVHASITSLGNIYTFMSNSNCIIIQKYKDQLEIMDIELKLKIVENWLINNKTDELIYNSISASCQLISKYLNDINIKITASNQKWVYYTRTINLDVEMEQLKKHIKILNNRIKYIAMSK